MMKTVLCHSVHKWRVLAMLVTITNYSKHESLLTEQNKTTIYITTPP